MFVHDPRNDKARALLAVLTPQLSALAADPDVLVVLGGDGFLLHTVAGRGTAPLYVGLNAGTLGFLLNDVADRLDEVVALLQARAWYEHRVPLLEATIRHVDGTVSHVQALNDVYLERSSGQTTRLKVSIDDQVVVNPLVADGIIFATALGSTAYSLSAGGAACHPAVQALCMTPICPHAPRLPPLVLPPTAKALVEVFVPERRPVRAVADGRAFEDVVEVRVAYGPQHARLGLLDGHDFTAAMVRKVL